jgi:hypothetical protein
MSPSTTLAAAIVGLIGSVTASFWIWPDLKRFPGLTGLALGSTFLIGLLSLALAALALAELPASWWVIAFLILANGLLQPICLFIFVLGIYKLAMAIRGRVTWGFQVVPVQDLAAADYRWLRWHSAASGTFCLLLSVCLSSMSLSPLF